jgi:hypothetical protein
MKTTHEPSKELELRFSRSEMKILRRNAKELGVTVEQYVSVVLHVQLQRFSAFLESKFDVPPQTKIS